jgi:NitT/TauT family transport system permease protein
MAQVVVTTKEAEGPVETGFISIPWRHRLWRWVRSPRPFRMLVGFALFFILWYVLVDVLRLPRFKELPRFDVALVEWLSREPVFGTSLFTAEYYKHIYSSAFRVYVAFVASTALGVPIGILMGWKRVFFGLTFPILEMLRPIPILAWIPLAIILMPGRQLPIIFLTFLSAFFVAILNTLLGVRSIDPVYFRAARCLGFSERAILFHVIIPGALPYIFTGLQIGMGACWFSLVAAEIVSGQSGLGYAVWQSYFYVQFPTMVIMMSTLGFCGYFSSAVVRMIGARLMRWRGRHISAL